VICTRRKHSGSQHSCKLSSTTFSREIEIFLITKSFGNGACYELIDVTLDLCVATRVVSDVTVDASDLSFRRSM